MGGEFFVVVHVYLADLEIPCQRLDYRVYSSARRTPRRPKIDQHRLGGLDHFFLPVEFVEQHGLSRFENIFARSSTIILRPGLQRALWPARRTGFAAVNVGGWYKTYQLWRPNTLPTQLAAEGSRRQAATWDESS